MGGTRPRKDRPRDVGALCQHPGMKTDGYLKGDLSPVKERGAPEKAKGANCKGLDELGREGEPRACSGHVGTGASVAGKLFHVGRLHPIDSGNPPTVFLIVIKKIEAYISQ